MKNEGENKNCSMEEKNCPNKKLAQEYFHVVVPYSGNLKYKIYNYQRGRIARLNINLADFYYKNGKSLDKLKNKGICKENKKILELILDKGVEEAKEIIIEKKIEDMAKEERFTGSKYFPIRKNNVLLIGNNSVDGYEEN